LNGCFSKSVDCDAVVDNVLYDEGGWFFNENEKTILRSLKDFQRTREELKRWKRSDYMFFCNFHKDRPSNLR
jgi:hypothetical protein